MKKQFEFLKCMLQSKVRDEKGATMVEYALMVTLIAVFCILAVTDVGTQASATFGAVATAITP